MDQRLGLGIGVSTRARFINSDQRSKFVTKIWHDMHDKFMSVSILKQKALKTS